MKFQKWLIILTLILVGVFALVLIMSLKRERDTNYREYKRKDIQVAGNELNVYIADTEEKRRVGLAAFEEIDENEGMLFIFDEPSIRSFWMMGMKFDIDIIWIFDNKIVDITNNVPVQIGVEDNELIKYQSKTEADKVLEVSAGWADRKNIKIGDGLEI